MEIKTTEWYTENLKRYLEQYKTAVYRRKQLETRLWKVCKEMDRPIGGMHYSPVNVSSKENLGSAAFTLRKSELEARIGRKKAKLYADRHQGNQMREREKFFKGE